MKKIDREEFAKEIKEERMLREYIRKAVAIVQKRKEKQLLDENKLRGFIRALILEGTPPSSDKPQIHKSKGMNELHLLLTNTQILDALKTSYQSLTTSKESRDSFRAHLINNIENILNQIDVNRKLDEVVKVDVGEDVLGPEGFVDPNETKEDKKLSAFSIPGMDLTGRDEAMEAYDKIETQVKKSYGKLHDPKDQKLFRDYIITNLKMWFDTWEEELGESIEEPTTDEYEQEKAEQGERF
tara:strand:+ start:221 stop:943 length:723 start_codon:yes stop_codon:yes gene_type:complete